MNRLYLKLVLCTLIGAILALSSHIYISEWVNPFITKMMEGLNSPTGNYPFHITAAAYGTTFVTVGLLVFVYYQAGHLLTISNSGAKVLVLTVIILEMKGSLLRQPLMDYLINSSLYGMEHPFAFILLSNIDKWIANLFISFCLVYFCPTRYKAASSSVRITHS